jgi:rod shape-determining protein MreC
MEKLPFLIQARKETLLYLSAFVLLSLVLLVLPQQVKSDISGFVYRFTYGPFYALGSHIQELEGVREENKKLHRKVMEFSLKNFWLEEERLENRRLRELLDFRSELEYKVIPADLVGAEPNRRHFSVLINKGSDEGIRRNMPVVNMHGLVGKTVDVSPHTSVVQLMIDPSFRVSALDQRSRVYGIIRPGSGFSLTLDNVPLTEDIEVGDGVISSGLGGIFPAGIKIGTVIAVETQKTLSREDYSFGIFKRISVRPSVDPSSLEEVFVMEVEKAIGGEDEFGPE